MRVFAIADLHLSFSSDKPMDVFGEAWRNHPARIEAAWREVVSEDDLILLPGDMSWAMQPDGARPDLDFIAALPGEKLLLRGNHDFWWSSPTKLRAMLPDKMHILQNDAFSYRGITVAGTRGWSCPNSAGFSENDRKIYERECLRLGLSLDAAKRFGGTDIVMTHFPPMNEKRQESGFTERIAASGARLAVYGHLHGIALRFAFEGERDGVSYHCVAADHLDFAPKLILEG